MNVGNFKFAFVFLVLLAFFVPAQQALGAELPAGKVVWWGKNYLWSNIRTDNTNGLVEEGDEFLTNAVGVTATMGVLIALKSDGTVFAFGLSSWPGVTDLPVGLSNVVSIKGVGNSIWAIKGDGTIASWGGFGHRDPHETTIIASLTNITSVVSGGFEDYLALQKDGTVTGFQLGDAASSDNSTQGSPIHLLAIQGQVLSNVVALASMDFTLLVLKNDGTVYSLGYETPGDTNESHPLFEVSVENSNSFALHPRGGFLHLYASLDPVRVDGQVLSNVVALASDGRESALALKRNGTVVAWRNKDSAQIALPSDLSNVVAIAGSGNQGLALKKDGTVTAWGNDNQFGQASVPAGLSNVVAIAAGGNFNLAVTTRSIPSSVFVQPHGRLEEMEREADLVFKGRVISTSPITNSAFPSWGKPHATKLEVISVFKGEADNKVVFLHNTHGPNAWSGGRPPQDFILEPGGYYIIFAANVDKPDYLYSPASNTVAKLDEFRQLMRGTSPIRTLNARPIPSQSVKEAHWFELNLFLNDVNPTNLLYAIDKLDRMSLAGRSDDEWMHSEDFKRKSVLNALLHVITNSNDQVASRAINCFATQSNAAVRLEPFADTLIAIANESPSPNSRLSAIEALSGIAGEVVSNSLAQLLKNPDENIRLDAVRLLPRFPEEFAEQGLRELADDKSANVRSVVADVIGDRKYERSLPVLVKLFSDPVGKDKLIPPTTTNYLRAGQRRNNIGDVHTATGYALVKFAPDQVSDILKTNLNDPGFHINFVAKLAQGDAEPWLSELVSILEARRAFVDGVTNSPWNDPRRFADPQADRILIGTYTECWEDIRQYLLKKSPEELASGKFDRYMDLLDKTVGEPEDRWLYQLYRTKNLANRAANLRRQYDKSDGWWFDDFNERGEAAGVDPVVF